MVKIGPVSIQIKGEVENGQITKMQTTINGVKLPPLPRLTEPQRVALRLCWLADRNQRHPDLTITGFLGYESSYSDWEGNVRSGCELTRTPTMKRLSLLGLVDRMDSYTFHITTQGRVVAGMLGFSE
jgi:hypothetical protein